MLAAGGAVTRQPRLFTPKAGSVTDIGFGKMKKENQDTYFEGVEFGGRKDVHVFGVFDGHGTQGLKVAKFVERELPAKLLEKQTADSLVRRCPPAQGLPLGKEPVLC